MTYQSPTQDIQFALETCANLEKLALVTPDEVVNAVKSVTYR